MAKELPLLIHSNFPSHNYTIYFKTYPKSSIYTTSLWLFRSHIVNVSTNPNALKNLFYVRQGDNANIVNRKIARDAALPDDLQIAAVSSKIVREMVIKTMQEFYDT